jgi:hypothetical protein
MTLTDGEEIEGLATNDRSLIDSSGILVTPPDTRSNTQRIFVPRKAIEALEVVSVIGAGSRRRGSSDGASAGRGKEAGQAALFPDEPDTE